MVNGTVSWLDLSEKDIVEYADTHYYNGLSGVGLYLEQCKKANIYLSDGLEKAREAIGSMILRKEYFPPMDILSAKAGVLSNVRLLLFKYQDTRNITYWEQIDLLLQYIDVSVEEDFALQLASGTTVHVSSLMMLLFRLYQARPDYITLNLMHRLGKLLVNQTYRYGLSPNEAGDSLVAAALLKTLFPEGQHFASLYALLSSLVLAPSFWNDQGFEQGTLKISFRDGALQRLGSRLITAGKITGESKYEVCLEKIRSILDRRTSYLTDSLSSGICADLDFFLDLCVMKQDRQSIHKLISLLAYGYSVNGSLRVKNAEAWPKPGLYDGLAGVGYSLLRFLEPNLESPLALT